MRFPEFLRRLSRKRGGREFSRVDFLAIPDLNRVARGLWVIEQCFEKFGRCRFSGALSRRVAATDVMEVMDWWRPPVPHFHKVVCEAP
jgi:hypothetical protein